MPQTVCFPPPVVDHAPGPGADGVPPAAAGHPAESPTVAAAEALATVRPSVGSIAAVTRTRLLTVGVEASLAEVAALLSGAQISVVVVCDGAGATAGVITETILVRQLGLGRADVFSTGAGQVMSRDFRTCRAADSLADVLAMMHLRGLIHVPVIDEARRPIGVLNARDGLRVLLAAGNQEGALLRDYVTGVGYR